MMLQPKGNNKNKLLIWRDFNLGDFAVAMALAVLSFVLGFTILPSSVNEIFKLILTIFFMISFSFLLIKNRKYNCRTYVLGFRALMYLFSSKKYTKNSTKGNTTFNLFPYEDIEDEMYIKTKNIKGGKRYLGVIAFSGNNPWSEDENDAEMFIKQFTDILDASETQMSIVRLRDLEDYSNNVNCLKKNRKEKEILLAKASEEVKENFKKYYDARMQDFEILDTNYEVDKYYLVLYSKNKNNVFKSLNNVSDALDKMGLLNEILKKEKLFKFLANKEDIDIDNETIEKYFSAENWEGDDHIYLDELLTVDEMIFKKNYFKKNELFYSIQVMSDLPLKLPNNWMLPLLSNNSQVVVQCVPFNEDMQAIMLDKGTKRTEDNINGIKSKYAKKTNELQLEAIEYLQNQLITNQNKLYDVQFLVINKANSLEELKEIENSNFREARKSKINLNPLPFKQFEAYSQACLITTNNLKEQMEMSSYNLSHGWAFENAMVNDGNINIASLTYDTAEPLIINRFYKNSSKRSNYNAFVLGSSGKGKSTFLGKEVLSLLAENNRVYILDIQGEYVKLCEKFGGEVIDLGSGKNTTLNPLEIRYQLYDEDEVDALGVKLIINKHLEWLEAYFKLICDEWKTAQIMMILKLVKGLYEEMGVYKIKTIEEISNFKYPIMSDLIQYGKRYKLPKGENITSKQILLADIVETLEYLFENNGKYEFIYNGQTNMNLDSDFIVFNISKLDIADDEISAVAVFVLISYLQTKIFNNFILDKKVNTTILVDEFHRFKDNKHTMDALFFMTKTVRKYNAGMLIASQNPSDFLASADASKKAEAIMMNSQYSYFFGLRQNDLEAVKKLYENSGGLNNSITTFLAKADIGTNLTSLHEYSKIKAEVFYNDFEKSILFKQGSFGKN
ncbi:Mbov_0397 family ICE element conjugal transfer ATPase [Mycoplasma sp. AA7A]|uniref:Mbov_0397 family ICE element conjugal transfer ATPase n=1 Tax=Mycoplasma TaxID=2093 RepID=UPI003A84F2ED